MAKEQFNANMDVKKQLKHERGWAGNYKYLTWHKKNTFMFNCYLHSLRFENIQLSMFMSEEVPLLIVDQRLYKHGIARVIST